MKNNMTIQQFIEIALEGEWAKDLGIEYTENYGLIQKLKNRSGAGFTLLDQTIIFLNPEAWKAVGKVKGWEKEVELEYEDLELTMGGSKFLGGILQYSYHEGGAATFTIEEWKLNMLKMIIFLIDGHNLEEYITTL